MDDLLRDLIAATDDIGAVVAPAETRRQLDAICATAALVFGAGAVSIARIDGDDLVYEASAGRGSEGIVGVRLAGDRSISGYVARTGQALVVEQVEHDPRFARDVAEQVGYVPTSMLVAPVTGSAGVTVGVLAVLDRVSGGGESLAIASSFAAQAALVLPHIDVVTHLAPLLLDAIAASTDNDDLARSIREGARRLPAATGDLDELTAALIEVRALGPEARAAATRILVDVVRVARAGRRRR